MVAEWITALAAAGGAAAMGAAGTDLWTGARDGLGRLFDRAGARRREVVLRQLDEDATEISRAVPTERDVLRERLAATWQTRLTDLLMEHPEVARELRAWAEAAQAGRPGTPTVVQHVTASGTGSVAQGTVGGDIHNHGSVRPPETGR
ncbi:hypothetical protein K7640_07100 [Micromonospora sp. PLK6-60]|uniref:hypothetical protein n=1 Tax=Micromonospora sp. PLK6-60 TaxID=2873383 RepID=UPI001CA73136|nr:hypothetical protein [Micromonospora sp. PLK6-60]MBY8871611.1 hypothetical protein [Micromonospora sp. PLK6-60]